MGSPFLELMRDQARTLRIGVATLALGLLLSGLSLVLLIGPTTKVGDVDGVEASLRPRATTSSQPPVRSEARPESIPDSAPTPLWQPNPESNLQSLSWDPGPSPVRLIMEGIGVDATVEGYGVNQRSGQMEVPGNVRDVGWYRHGPAPGQPGSAVLAAHVDLDGQGRGVFFDLKKVEPGDKISVEFDDGSIKEFVVEGRSIYSKDELPLDVIFSRHGPPVLTLITCGGGFDATSRRYDSNVVVYAKPLIDPSPALIERSEKQVSTIVNGAR